MVEEFCSVVARAVDAVAGAVRGRKLNSTMERGVAELRERVEDLEDSLAAFAARAERDETTLRPWTDVRQ